MDATLPSLLSPPHSGEQMLQLRIEGMTCASCVARVEKALRAPSVAEVTVNLATEAAQVRLAAPSAGLAEVMAAVERAGYSAHPRGVEPIPAPAPAAGASAWPVALAALPSLPLALPMVGQLQRGLHPDGCAGPAEPGDRRRRHGVLERQRRRERVAAAPVEAQGSWGMNIGEAAALSGVSAKMMRHYESLGLLPRVARTDAGYRQYADNEVHTLRFIRRARDLGFSMAQIRELLKLWQNRRRASADVKRVALAHVADLERRMAELDAMKQTLQRLAASCHGDHRPECPILDDLAGVTRRAFHERHERLRVRARDRSPEMAGVARGRDR